MDTGKIAANLNLANIFKIKFTNVKQTNLDKEIQKIKHLQDALALTGQFERAPLTDTFVPKFSMLEAIQRYEEKSKLA